MMLHPRSFEPEARIELASAAYQAAALPLSYRGNVWGSPRRQTWRLRGASSPRCCRIPLVDVERVELSFSGCRPEVLPLNDTPELHRHFDCMGVAAHPVAVPAGSTQPGSVGAIPCSSLRVEDSNLLQTIQNRRPYRLGEPASLSHERVGSNHLDARFGISPATAASLVWPEGRDHAPDESNVGRP